MKTSEWIAWVVIGLFVLTGSMWDRASNARRRGEQPPSILRIGEVIFRAMVVASALIAGIALAVWAGWLTLRIPEDFGHAPATLDWLLSVLLALAGRLALVVVGIVLAGWALYVTARHIPRGARYRGKRERRQHEAAVARAEAEVLRRKADLDVAWSNLLAVLAVTDEEVDEATESEVDFVALYRSTFPPEFNQWSSASRSELDRATRTLRAVRERD